MRESEVRVILRELRKQLLGVSERVLEIAEEVETIRAGEGEAEESSAEERAGEEALDRIAGWKVAAWNALRAWEDRGDPSLAVGVVDMIAHEEEREKRAERVRREYEALMQRRRVG